MRRRSVRICFSCAFFLLAFFSPLTAAAQEKKSALVIFDAALGAFDNQRLALRNWQYHQTLITHQMDSAGNVVASGTWQSIVRPGDPRPLEYTASRVEGKLSFFKAQTRRLPRHQGRKERKQRKKKTRSNPRWKRCGNTTFAIAITGSGCLMKTSQEKAPTSSALNRNRDRIPNRVRNASLVCWLAGSG